MTGQVVKINSASLKAEQCPDERHLPLASRSDLSTEKPTDSKAMSENNGVKEKYHAVETALREVAYFLDMENQQLPEAGTDYRTDLPEDDAAKRENAQLPTKLANKLKNLEPPGDFQSLQDEMRGLRDRLSEENSEFKKNVEDHLCSNKSVLQELMDRFEKLEQKSYENEHTFAGIIRNLSEQAEADRARNEGAWNELLSSLVSVKKNLSTLEKQSDDVHGKLNANSMALSASFDTLSKNVVTIRSQMRELGSAFEHGLSALNNNITQELEASERRVQEFVDVHLEEANQARNVGERSLQRKYERITKKLNAEKTRNKAALSKVQTSLSQIAQGSTDTEERIRRELHDCHERVEQSLNEREHANSVALKDLVDKVAVESARGDQFISELRSIRETMEDEQRLEESVGTILQERLKQAETSQNKTQRLQRESLAAVAEQIETEKMRVDKVMSEVHALADVAKKQDSCSESRVREIIESYLIPQANNAHLSETHAIEIIRGRIEAIS